MPSWKTARNKRQTAKKTKLALVAFGIIIALIVLAQVFKFGHTLFSPWQMGKDQSNSYHWNWNSNINVLLRSGLISLLTFNPKDQKITIINIPDETYLETSHGFGSWQVRAIYPLGGDRLLKESLSNFFGIPIDGFLDNVSLGDLTNKNPLSIFSILPKIKTDLTLFELMSLKMSLSSVRFDKVNKIGLENLGLLDKSKLADGTEVLIADPVRLDSLSTYFLESIIQNEHKTIAVFNSTDHSGIAQKSARIITNIGGNVIIISNGQKKYKETQIVGEKSKTFDRLKQIFNGNGNIDPKDEDLVSSRAQINLFLGEDYFNSL